MKKFLSLLLALTMVMSLIVLPARATDETIVSLNGLSLSSTSLELEKGADTGNKLTVTGSATYGEQSNAIPEGATPTYTWDSSDKTVATVSGNSSEGTITTLKKGNANITCKVSYTWNVPNTSPTQGTDDADSSNTTMKAERTYTCALTVNDTAGDAANAAFKAAIATVTFNGRNYLSSGRVTAYKFDGDTDSAWAATVSSDSTATYTGISASYDSAANKITVTAKKSGDDVTAEFPCSLKSATATVVAKPTTIASNGESKLSVTLTAGTPTSYAWSYKEKNASGAGTSLGTGATASLKNVPAGKTYEVTCVATYKLSDSVTKTVTGTKDVTVENTTYAFAGSAIIYVNKNEAKSVDAKLYPVGSSTAVSDATYTYSVSPANVVQVASDGRITILNSGIAYVTVKSSYKGVEHTYSVTIYVSALMADFDRQAWYNSPATYYYSDLVTAANKALSTGNTYGSNYYATVNTIQTVSVNNNSLGTSTNTLSYGAQSGSITFTPYYNARGKAPVTVTLTTNTGKSVTVTLNIPVVPIPRTFDSLTAEPVTTNYTTSINNYRITFPSTYSTYYVVQKNGTTAPDYATVSLGNPYSAGSQYTLSSADFGTNGTCTLYVIATNNYTYGSSYGMYYSGAITVSQTNYNINYNGVTGETVQFAQSDFNDFMNKVAEARGDASKAKSYPYVTFDYVTFSLPTTAQGTLYYGGTAMSTSNSSGAFNRNTKVTNLDSVTFVPNDKTTAKTITLNFTLYATRYSSSSTSRGTTVSYSGSVVVNLVREDIKYTVSQGDSVRFDESDFLSYLRSTKGYTSNYTIDYVTFDQSAVSAVNEGSLYTYYNGYNYGGSVKTTDKFYYNATASQNALSDVAFLASRYAKTGETVYIPFTIYARYGSTGTGTRQLTGTVAIKIGQTMNFIDVKTTDYFYNSVKWAVGKNITNGTSSTTFSPYKSCTRAEIVTFLWRAAGSPEPTITRNPFRDVNAVTHSSYYKAILWASQKGITSGTSATAFSPDQVCTRAQIVTFLYRYAGQPSGYYSNPFKDVGATSEASYYNAIRWAVGKGITTGTSATTFSPYASCNRAEAVTFLYRYTNGL